MTAPSPAAAMAAAVMETATNLRNSVISYSLNPKYKTPAVIVTVRQPRRVAHPFGLTGYPQTWGAPSFSPKKGDKGGAPALGQLSVVSKKEQQIPRLRFAPLGMTNS